MIITTLKSALERHVPDEEIRKLIMEQVAQGSRLVGRYTAVGQPTLPASTQRPAIRKPELS